MQNQRKKSNKRNEPLTAFLDEYAGASVARFHMPGHKGRGRALHGAAQRDITEVAGADNLLSPTGILLDAQRETAAFYGATQTWFTTGGATAAMLAAITSLPPDALLFVPRNAHKSAISALALSGHEAVFLPAVYDADGRCPLPNVESLRGVLAVHPNRCRALLLTRPDYYGRCADIEGIAALCDEENVVLLVDEAHGAHFALSGALPLHAVPYADIVINSAHKTLDAPNQTAYLHRGQANHTGSPSPDQLGRNLALFQTSSPSYPHLEAMATAWCDQKEAWERHIASLYEWTDTLPGVWRDALRMGYAGEDATVFDPTRLSFDVATLGWTGYQADEWLRQRGVMMEMADERRVVGITSPLDDPAWYDRLRAALLALPIRDAHASAVAAAFPIPERAMRVRDAVQCTVERVELDRAEGRICAQSVGIYPPGAAVLTPGERIDADMLRWLAEKKREGAEIFGVPLLCVVE